MSYLVHTLHFNLIILLCFFLQKKSLVIVLSLRRIDHVISRMTRPLVMNSSSRRMNLWNGIWPQRWGTLPKDEIQRMLIGAYRIMDFALPLDIQLICLKQHALCVFHAAVTSGTCGRLLDILEAVYRYQESLERRQQGMTLATFNKKPDTEEVPIAEDSLWVSDEAHASAELAATLEIDVPTPSHLNHPLVHRRGKLILPNWRTSCQGAKVKSKGSGQKGCRWGNWLKPITEAIPLHPLRKGDLHLTGIDERKHLKIRTLFGKSIYVCTLCSYTTEQHAQAATHMRGMHLLTCIACRSCGYRTYRSLDFPSILEKKHGGKEAKW